MKVILPAAGKGTRLRPFSLYRSKSLLRIYSKPIIEHLIEKIKGWINFEEIILVISDDEFGYKAYEFLKKIYPKLNYKIQREPRGLADAIYLALDGLKGDVLIVLPDALYDGKFDFNENFLAVKEVEDPKRFGIVVLENSYVVDLEEKPENPRSNLAIVGIYYLKNSEILKQAIEILYEKDIKTKNEYQLTDALKILIDNNIKIKALKIDYWQDCGKLETYLQTMKDILQKKGTNVLSNLINSKIIEPVFIGENCIIENSIIGPFVDISENVIIKNSHIQNSIIMENSKISNAKIRDSIIGSNCKISNIEGNTFLGDFGKICGADRI